MLKALAQSRISILEWFFWLVLAYWFYSQSSRFDTPIAEYAFGADGWPKVLCFLIVAAATGQFLFRVFVGGNTSRSNAKQQSMQSRLTTIVFFASPLIYLFLLPTIGFYILTPLYIVALLLLLGVHKPMPVFSVTVVVYSLVLLVFTRLFYVALPVGSEGFFYDANTLIISYVRIGS